MRNEFRGLRRPRSEMTPRRVAMLSRRLFSAALLLAPQLRAQQAPKTIGVLSPLSSYEFEPSRDAFVIAMRDLGYVRG